MATIDESVRAQLLEPFRLPEYEVRMACWPLWIAHSFWDWYDSTEALHDETQSYGRRTMGEHIEQLFCDLRCSKRPGSAGDLKRMMPNADGVWSLHAYGVRCYGWSPGIGSFVVVTGALEAETKSNKKLNDLKRDEVKKFIRTHGLEATVKLGDINAIYPRQEKIVPATNVSQTG